MPELRKRLGRLSADLRPGVPRPPDGYAVIMDDADAERFDAWLDSLTGDEREALRASQAAVAVDFRLDPTSR